MKKPLFSNNKMSFEHLTPDDFEEVVKTFFQIQITNKVFEGKYDHVELSVGIGEKGADLKLYYNSMVVGCIQCKRLIKNVGPKIIIEDLVKFLINHILLSDLKGSSVLTNSIDRFTYYFVVSKDFTQTSKDLINEFRNEHSKYDIEEIVDSIKKKYKNLRGFNYSMQKNEIHEILNKITIKGINRTDLDQILRSDIKTLDRYYNVEKIISLEALDKFDKKLNKSFISKEHIAEIINRLNSHFRSLKRHFGHNHDLNIKRKETDEIFNWLIRPLNNQEKNLAIIAGNAGLGKTVIVSQLIDKLRDKNRTVIAIKADRFNVESHKALKDKIDLPVSFFNFINEVILENDELVLIIDQIDALSQSISTNMKSLQVFDDIIQNYLNNDKVRIIISCRAFDLNYDPILKNYSVNNVFKVHTLRNELVEKVLENAQVKNINSFSSQLKDLLKTPLHLDIFLEIYTTELKVKKITTIQDLYNVLWDKKLLNPVNFDGGLKKEKIIELVFSIADKMYQNQEINTISIPFRDTYTNELRYLESTSLVNENNKLIEFFHQSFFEYIIARKFVSEGKSITEDIKEKHQGLFLRSKIQQILTYKRSVDSQSYINELNNLIIDEGIRFHIKALVLQLVAFQEQPTQQEIRFIKRVFEEYDILKEMFLSFYHGGGWFEVFIENNWIINLIKSPNKNTRNLIGIFLRKQSKDNKKAILNFFYNNQTDEIFKDYIIDFLWRIEGFDDNKYIQLIELVFQNEYKEKNKFQLYHILKHAIKNYPDWVAKYIFDDYPKNIDFDNFDNNLELFPGSIHNQDLYNDFWKIHPKKAYYLVKSIILKTIQISSKESEKSVSVSKAFLLFTHKEDQMYFHHKQLKKLYEYLIEEFTLDPAFVKSEAVAFIDYDNPNIHEVIIGFKVFNTYPREFKDELFKVYSNLDLLSSLIGFEQYMNYLIYNTFGKVYGFWSLVQKQVINDIILNFYPSYELRSYDLKKRGKKLNKNYGRSILNFLSQLEFDEINSAPKLKTKLNELERKFGELSKIEEPKGVVVTIGGNVLSSAAYENMSFDNWKKTFIKFDESDPEYDTWKGISELEHSRLFSKKVAEDPIYYFPFVESLIDEKLVPSNYVLKGLEGLYDSGKAQFRIASLIKQVIQLRTLDSYQNTQLLWLIQKIVKDNFEDEVIFNFVQKIVREGAEDDRGQIDLLTSGINSERGAAVYTLMDFSRNKTKHILILDHIKEMALKSNQSTRACALVKLSNFLQFSRRKAFETFNSLMVDNAIGLVKLTPHFLNYSDENEFISLNEFYSKAILIPEAYESIGQLLTKFYCFSFNGAEKLITDFQNQNIQNCEPIVTIAWKFVQSHIKGEPTDEVKRAIALLFRFLDVENSKVAKEIGR